MEIKFSSLNLILSIYNFKPQDLQYLDQVAAITNLIKVVAVS